MRKLAIVLTHPIQYYSPIFSGLQDRGNIKLRVFYSRKKNEASYHDAGFSKVIKWDIPLLEGYEYEFNTEEKSIGKLASKISAYAPDALLIFGWNPPGHFWLMRHFSKSIPIWFRGDSTMLDQRSFGREIIRRIYLSWVYQHVDKAFYVGSFNRDYYLAHGLKDTQLTLAPHAIDNSRFTDSDQRKYEMQALDWRKKLGLEARDFTIVYAGKVDANKNVALLTEAVAKHNHINQPLIKLIVIGSGDMEVELRNTFHQDENILFLGFQNQSTMPIAYRLGHCACLPSKSETWGLAVNESLACGRPVIVSDKVGCHIDLISSPRYGRVFRSKDLSSLGAAIAAVKHDFALGDISQEIITDHVQNWSIGRICEVLEAELNDLRAYHS